MQNETKTSGKLFAFQLPNGKPLLLFCLFIKNKQVTGGEFTGGVY